MAALAIGEPAIISCWSEQTLEKIDKRRGHFLHPFDERDRLTPRSSGADALGRWRNSG
jgi:hypothetical protein